MSKPIIGISVDCVYDPADSRTRGKLTLNWNYAEAITTAGGVPILIPPTADMESVAPLIDGWLVPGGDDIDASEFGEENHPKVGLQDPRRFAAEARLFKAVNPELPYLGICYGCQFLNVQRGGTLIQHLPDLVHHEDHAGGTLQHYKIETDSKLAKSAGGVEMEGKSYHHQAVGRLGSELRIVAKSEDGTVEAIEDDSKPFLIGVQWHPERTLEDAATQRLFESFVNSAAEYKAKRQGT